MGMRKDFALDRQNGKLMGVCAGLANYLNVDATIVRVGVVVLTLVGGFPWTVIAYGVAAWAAKPASAHVASGRVASGHTPYADPAPRRASTAELRETMRDIDRRLAEIDTYVTSSNSRLAREIEELR